ncbi:DUF2510 domain-containing protein [Nocardioides marmoraquaticus]
MSNQQPTPPGWYPDPESPSLRFWNGNEWTDQRAPLPQRQQGVSTQKLVTGVGLGVLAAAGAIWFLIQVSQPSELDCAVQEAERAMDESSYVDPDCR